MQSAGGLGVWYRRSEGHKQASHSGRRSAIFFAQATASVQATCHFTEGVSCSGLLFAAAPLRLGY